MGYWDTPSYQYVATSLFRFQKNGFITQTTHTEGSANDTQYDDSVCHCFDVRTDDAFDVRTAICNTMQQKEKKGEGAAWSHYTAAAVLSLAHPHSS